MTELILALDVRDGKRGEEIACACRNTVDAIKVGYPLVLSSGLGIARRLASAADLPLIADFKVADIPNTNTMICEEVFSAGFSAVICHGFTGRDAIEACTTVAHDHGGACYVVTEMSHPGAVEFFHGGVAERLAQLAVETGADGIIAPATRPERLTLLRDIIGRRKIFSPGVGVQGGDAGTVSPLVDGIIVGRAIYDDPDPAGAASKIAGQIRR